VADWDAKTYERISEPQFAWGKRVLERLPLRGDETVVDAGCGAGRLTELLAAKVPHGRVVAIDASDTMLEQARQRLAPLGDRVSFVRADVATHVEHPPVDAVFSTATFHWVRDHDALFDSIFASLRPGGRLVAQWGGGPNLARLVERTDRLRASATFGRFFAGWPKPWLFATADETGARLRRAGFVDPQVWLEAAPARFDDAAAFREFVTTVCLRNELAQIPDASARGAYLEAVVDAASRDDPPFELDYWRLNADAQAAE
jgi:trans-aconitate methyltransferase